MLDVVISGGDVLDGTGGPARHADVGIAGDRIVALGPPGMLVADGARVIDATGRVVCPGFINILSHSYFSVLTDPRSLGELTQGVTTQVFGEGTSMGPLTPAMQAELQASREPDEDYEVTWTRLGEYLRFVEKRGCAQNVASLIGAATLRVNVIGYADRPATPAEIDEMRALVAEEMADGALGIGSSLIYPPGAYADTAELTALCKVAARYDGLYASHVRNEGARLLAATDEFTGICRDAGIRGEHWHLKASGTANWHLMDEAIARLEAARAAGLEVTADVYPYTASSTGLTTIIPDRFHDGGREALYDRLRDPSVRAEIRRELAADARWGDVASAEGVLILQAVREENRRYQGLTLTQVAEKMGTEPIEAAMDLIASDRSRIGVAFFAMTEDNLRKALAQPWVAICSDGASMAPEGAFLQSPTHPRAYGSFARVLGHYVRDEQVLSLPEAIRRMSALPASTLGLSKRGQLKEGYFADVVVFDPGSVADLATFEQPHRLSAGVTEVLVNGQVAISGGAFAGALAGRALAGPGVRR
ncbi:MAG TPA: D-aminoacylase [Streptosporangiaceae bacterium]